ncbi:MAG: riboflavin biosynthesis protein RibF [Planctomycetota bacterium]|nr:riboflavin biosynthesis protein RibF [Planctomycetota bacterium]
MRRYFDVAQASRDRRPGQRGVATVGLFDGVHRGHVDVLRELESWASSVGAEPVVVTFDRRPQAVLEGRAHAPVISLDHRLLLLERHGVAATLVLHFDRELASWPPERFVEEILRDALGARHLLLGFDSAFGRDRQGTYEYLAARRDELGLELRRCGARNVLGERVSSTCVRDALRAGDLERVGVLLGRRYSLLGRVVHGDHRGKSIGFPTANLDLGDAAVLPRGVYFADAVLLGPSLEASPQTPGTEGRGLPAVVNVGRRPTFTGDETEAGAFDPRKDKVEAHILDFEGNLYGQYLEVFVDRKLRDEVRFDSAESLVRQIRSDVQARRAFG